MNQPSLPESPPDSRDSGPIPVGESVAEVRTLALEVDRLKENCDLLAGKVLDLRAELTTMRGQRDAWKIAAEQFNGQRDGLRTELASAEECVTGRGRRIKELIQERVLASTRADRQEKNAKLWEKTAEKIAKERDRIRGDSDDVRSQNEFLTDQHTRLVDRRDNLLASRDRLLRERDELRSDMESVENDRAALRKKLQAACRHPEWNEHDGCLDCGKALPPGTVLGAPTETESKLREELARRDLVKSDLDLHCVLVTRERDAAVKALALAESGGRMTKDQHLLTVLAEECAEVAQRSSKAIRFGLHEVQPGQGMDNRQRIEKELGDLLGVCDMLGLKPNQFTRKRKPERVLRFLKYSVEIGAADPGTLGEPEGRSPLGQEKP